MHRTRRRRPKSDLTGQSFGRLTCLSYVGKEVRKRPGWLCRCDCGNELVIDTYCIKSGNTKSCGCLRKEETSKRMTVHGKSQNNYYFTLYNSIRARCYNTKYSCYRRYGGRGIKLYSDWLSDFTLFEQYILTHLGPRPSSSYSLDRIDSNGDYAPGNLRWANDSLQGFNKYYRTRKSGFRGIERRKNRYRAVIQKGVERMFIGSYGTIEEAVSAYKQKCLELYGELPPEYK